MIGLRTRRRMVLFVLARIAKLSLERTTWRSALVIPLLFSLIAITLIPELTLCAAAGRLVK